MNWEIIGSTGEWAGAIAVVVTLFYLATQIKQSNDLGRFNATKESMNQFNHLNEMVVTDSELRQILMKSCDLSADEREVVYNFAMMYCAVWATIQTAYDSGQIDKSFYAASTKDVQIEMDRWPNFQSAIEQWLSNYPELAHYEIFRPVVSRRVPPNEPAI